MGHCKEAHQGSRGRKNFSNMKKEETRRRFRLEIIKKQTGGAAEPGGDEGGGKGTMPEEFPSFTEDS